jgi:hypothetical protein
MIQESPVRPISPSRNNQNDRIVLGLLQAVERESGQSQRRLAAELGIALGLVNIYLKRCVNKGLLKMAQAPARRYAYWAPRTMPVSTRDWLSVQMMAVFERDFPPGWLPFVHLTPLS